MRAAGQDRSRSSGSWGRHFPADEDDPNWLPRMQVYLGLAHDALQHRRYEVATTNADAARESARVHGTAYERSFAEWTAMLSEEGRDPTVGSVARAYAAGLARQRWDERIGRLASARAQIHSERQQGQHEGLVRRTMEDPLTGLGNRRAFDQRLVHECDNLTPQTTIAMVIIDVDQFKAVNDRFGHACGDAVLCRVGAIIRSVLRPEDLALRLGGDEFCAVLTGASPEVVQDRADRSGPCEPGGLAGPRARTSRHGQCRSRDSRRRRRGRGPLPARTPPSTRPRPPAPGCSASRSDQRRGLGGHVSREGVRAGGARWESIYSFDERLGVHDFIDGVRCSKQLIEAIPR